MHAGQSSSSRRGRLRAFAPTSRASAAGRGDRAMMKFYAAAASSRGGEPRARPCHRAKEGCLRTDRPATEVARPTADCGDRRPRRGRLGQPRDAFTISCFGVSVVAAAASDLSARRSLKAAQAPNLRRIRPRAWPEPLLTVCRPRSATPAARCGSESAVDDKCTCISALPEALPRALAPMFLFFHMVHCPTAGGFDAAAKTTIRKQEQ